MTSLTDLIERVRSGSGEDRELDCLILCALAAPEGSYVEQSKINGVWCIYERPGRTWEKSGRWWRPEGWPLTTSLDAVVRLAEEKLPGTALGILTRAITECPFRRMTLETFPREYLACLLLALQAQEGTDG